MTTVRKALAEDFDKIYQLLLEFRNPYISKNTWKGVFVDHWNCHEGYYGYILLDDDNVVGYLGVIFSRRHIGGKQHKICNLTSWLVKEKYRSKSLSLFFPILKLKDYTLTDHSASKEVYSLSKKLGFDDFETHIRKIYPIPMKEDRSNKCSLLINNEAIENDLDEKSLKIYQDHVALKCDHVVIKSDSGICYMLITKTYRKNFAFGHIHYVSNTPVFLKTIDVIRTTLCLRLKVFGLHIDERHVSAHKIAHSRKQELHRPRIFKSQTLTRDDIDTLYSEYQVLSRKNLFDIFSK